MSLNATSVVVQSRDFEDTRKLLNISEIGPETESNPTSTTPQQGENSEILDIARVPCSPSRISFRRVSSPTPDEREPRSFMWLAALSCMCPALPINLFALYFAHMSRSMIQTKDYDGARRLGRLALLLSIVSIVVGIAVVCYLVMTDF